MAPWKEQFVHDLDSGGTCRVPWCVSTSDNDLDHVNFDGSRLKVVWERGLAETEPVFRWTPLRKGERVQVIGGEHFVNWLGTAQGEMMDGTEQVIVDGKDSPWSFNPRHLVRVYDTTVLPNRVKIPGLDVEVPVKQYAFNGGPEIPDTDEEHELAAGVFTEDSVDENKQLVLALPFTTLPNTNACNFIFGDGFTWSRLVEWAELFVQKQRDYGNGADDLGEAGQYAELHRKITKLRRSMWEGIPLENEPTREVLMDLIGHCFLGIMYIDQPRHTRYPKGNPNK